MVKHIGNSNGQSLVQVLVSVGIMGILILAMASVQSAQNRENRALDEKLGGLDVQRTMAAALADGTVCKYMLQNPAITFNSTAVLAGTPQTQTLTTPVYANVVSGVPGPVVVQPIANPPRGTMPVKAITLTVSSGSGNTFLGSINAVFDDSKLIRNIRPASASVILNANVTNPNAATVTTCVGSNSSTCWELSGTSLYSTCAANVGIGTTAPTERLDLGGGSIKMGYIQRNNSPWTTPATASCIGNEQAVGGGCSCGGANASVHDTRPDITNSKNWICACIDSSGNPSPVASAWVLCANIK